MKKLIRAIIIVSARLSGMLVISSHNAGAFDYAMAQNVCVCCLGTGHCVATEDYRDYHDEVSGETSSVAAKERECILCI